MVQRNPSSRPYRARIWAAGTGGADHAAVRDQISQALAQLLPGFDALDINTRTDQRQGGIAEIADSAIDLGHHMIARLDRLAIERIARPFEMGFAGFPVGQADRLDQG